MNAPQFYRRRQKAVVIVGMLLFQLLLFFLQIWLFVALLEHAIAGDASMAVPAAIASLAVLGINVWMLRGVSLLSRSS